MAANPGAVVFLVFIMIVIFKIVELIKEKIFEYKISKENKMPEYSDFDYIDALNNKVFGDFKLSEAVAIFKDSKIVPREGYVIEKFTAENGNQMNRIIISVSEENIYSLFDDLLSLFGETVSVAIEDFLVENGDHVDYFAYHKETVLIRSIFTDYENVFVRDGFLGISVFEHVYQTEVKITDHKTIDIYAFDTTEFKNVLALYGLQEEMMLQFFYEEGHFHLASSNHEETIESLKNDLLIEQAIFRPLDSEESCV